MTFKLGPTGSIGMGKSTTAQFFADEGCDVWDADATVHRLYAPGGPAIVPVAALVPEALRGDVLDRDVLRDAIRSDQQLLSKIEQIVHPLVRSDRAEFLRSAASDIVVFDIPLLFETQSDKDMDAVACVVVDRDTQKERVLARGTMTEADLDLILSRQMPIEEKLAKSDYVIETYTLDDAKARVKAVVKDIRETKIDA